MRYTEHFADETDWKIMMNEKDELIQEKIKLVLQEVEKARVYFNVPFTITSGYRTTDYNKAVRGAKNSQHTKGEAVDFMCSGNLFAVYTWCVKKLDYDQIIFETRNNMSWIHFSRKEKRNRKEALIAVYENGKYKYTRYEEAK